MNSIKYILKFGNNDIHTKSLINHKLLRHLKHQFRCCSSVLSELPELQEDDELWNKIIYSEVLNKRTVKRKLKSNSDTGAIFLKYLSTEDNKVNKSKVESSQIEEEKSECPNFPYQIKKQFLEVKESPALDKPLPEAFYNFTPSDNEKGSTWGVDNFKLDIRSLENPVRWAQTNEGLENDNPEDVLQFGSFDPNQRVSKVPCGGCGAFLHCNDPSIPGFIPAEIFTERTKKELLAEICQRCHFLKEFDISLGVNVSPSEYINILSQIKNKHALAILMVDMLDFPCSIFPGVLDIIGPSKPVVIVGNKVDLLLQEGPLCLDYFKTALLNELKKQGMDMKNIKLVSLISAKTGYGIEELINQLHLKWGFEGDVYLIGCTNVGKSTLFNTLIQSDYCKVKAVNMLQRATISPWPGTTLNLLKFPIMRPTKSRLAARLLRLRYQKKEQAALQKLQWLGQNIKLEQIPLKGHVGQTFAPEPERGGNELTSDKQPVGLDPKTHDFIKSRWFYDTPGVVQQDQIVNLLTTSELLLTVPQSMLLPRNFHLRPGHSIFIAGLGRLDYISGTGFVWFTVFASMKLPITVTKLEDADYVYKKLLGSPLFRVPMKGKERLAKWPELSSKKFEIVGGLDRFKIKEKLLVQQRLGLEASADVVLSSAGWVAVAVPNACLCNVEAWTPEGRGIYLRNFPIIKNGFDFRGNKISGTPAFKTSVKEKEGYSLTEEPPL